MTENNLIHFEDVRVSTTRSQMSFKVDLEMEEYTFYIKKGVVDEIVDKTGEDENLIAIIIAYVKYASF